MVVWGNSFKCVHIYYISKKLEGLFAIVYYDSDMTSTSNGILFEYFHGPKFIIMSEDISLAALRKVNTNVIVGRRISLGIYYHQQVYIGNSCVEYIYMELKDDNDV